MAGLKWPKSQNGPLWLKLAVKTIESNWVKSSQPGPGSSWAWPILTLSQIGPRSQYESEHHDSGKDELLLLGKSDFRLF